MVTDRHLTTHLLNTHHQSAATWMHRGLPLLRGGMSPARHEGIPGLGEFASPPVKRGAGGSASACFTAMFFCHRQRCGRYRQRGCSFSTQHTTHEPPSLVNGALSVSMNP